MAEGFARVAPLLRNLTEDHGELQRGFPFGGAQLREDLEALPIGGRPVHQTESVEDPNQASGDRHDAITRDPLQVVCAGIAERRAGRESLGSGRKVFGDEPQVEPVVVLEDVLQVLLDQLGAQATGLEALALDAGRQLLHLRDTHLVPVVDGPAQRAHGGFGLARGQLREEHVHEAVLQQVEFLQRTEVRCHDARLGQEGLEGGDGRSFLTYHDAAHGPLGPHLRRKEESRGRGVERGSATRRAQPRRPRRLSWRPRAARGGRL